MKYLAFALFLCGCAGSGGGSTASPGACASSPIVGSWVGLVLGNSDTLTFSGDCSGSDSYCAAVFTYPNVTATSGTVLVRVTAKNSNAGCLPLGETGCAYQISGGTTLQYDCGNGVLTFTKQ